MVVNGRAQDVTASTAGVEEEEGGEGERRGEGRRGGGGEEGEERYERAPISQGMAANLKPSGELHGISSLSPLLPMMSHFYTPINSAFL